MVGWFVAVVVAVVAVAVGLIGCHCRWFVAPVAVVVGCLAG